MNGMSSVWVVSSIETWPSLIASSSADCVRGVVRLISSASTMLAKIGPCRSSNTLPCWSYTDTPTMSDGNRSLVNWMRRNVPPSAAASARASVVLPTPGMSSINRWPRDSRVTMAARIDSGLPRTTVATASSSFRTAPMSVDDIGADPRPPRPEVELPEDTGTAGMFGEYSLKTPAAIPVRDGTDRRRPWPDVGPGRPVSGGEITPALAAIVQRHHELQHVPEQRGDGREQHQRGCDERLGREMAHHQAGLIQDV